MTSEDNNMVNSFCKVPKYISLLKYTKSACGVDFLLNTANSDEKKGWFNQH